MVLTRMGSNTGQDDRSTDIRGTPVVARQRRVSAGTSHTTTGGVPAGGGSSLTKRNGGGGGGGVCSGTQGAMEYYAEQKRTSFLQRATTAIIDNSLDVSRHYLALWIALVFGVLLVRQFLSDGGFSSSLTLSGVLQCFSYLLLSVKVIVQWNGDGISRGSLFLSGMGLATRLYPNIFYLGYLPVDKSGDWLYQVVDVMSLMLVGLLLLCLWKIQMDDAAASSTLTEGGRGAGVDGGLRGGGGRVKRVGGGRTEAGPFQSQRTLDGVPGYVKQDSACGGTLHDEGFADLLVKFVNDYYLEICLCGISLLGSLFFHANRNRHFLSDVSWAFSFYLDSMAMIPQLLLMTKEASTTTSGDVEKWTAHYLAAMGASSIASLFFWWKTSKHLEPGAPTGRIGWAVFSAVVFRNLVMIDYLYHYVKAMLQGQNLRLRRWSSLNV
eukprot:GHVQ01019433.1.p1 GENE.GHVQ01019433.1~~GHVQ01019433.1.p1  ORF type:complete len:487 (+),score=67.29 GHVQ01019433.1:151-1461(+)